MKGKCLLSDEYYDDCSEFNLDHCKRCQVSGKCAQWSGNYYTDNEGKCYKNLTNIVVPIVMSVIVLILIIIIIVICIKKEKK